MDPMRDLPTGFGMALLQNKQAANAFYALTPAQQQEILQRTHTVSSRAEMLVLVAELANQSGPDPFQTT